MDPNRMPRRQRDALVKATAETLLRIRKEDPETWARILRQAEALRQQKKT